ncbi:MAG: PTS sugar transporter subunit IIB [Tissierellia bacterium]|nr:PTS sugar transporter subunit IIB [Tissierellia bacterium]MDD4779301.1 PTS sugar transporter subunit IIB [Tissierellia bacterium]
MKNIILTRIDDRLLHGQVMVSWIPLLEINEVIIIDDEYAADEFMSNLIVESSPVNLTVKVLSVKDSAEYILSGSNDSRVLLISRSVESINNLLEMKVPIHKINVGGLGYLEGRKKYYNFIHMSDNEFKLLKEIAGKGISVEVQMLPKDKVTTLK